MEKIFKLDKHARWECKCRLFIILRCYEEKYPRDKRNARPLKTRRWSGSRQILGQRCSEWDALEVAICFTAFRFTFIALRTFEESKSRWIIEIIAFPPTNERDGLSPKNNRGFPTQLKTSTQTLVLDVFQRQLFRFTSARHH